MEGGGGGLHGVCRKPCFYSERDGGMLCQALGSLAVLFYHEHQHTLFKALTVAVYIN